MPMDVHKKETLLNGYFSETLAFAFAFAFASAAC